MITLKYHIFKNVLRDVTDFISNRKAPCIPHVCRLVEQYHILIVTVRLVSVMFTIILILINRAIVESRPRSENAKTLRETRLTP